jgi:hypothetical protein
MVQPVYLAYKIIYYLLFIYYPLSNCGHGLCMHFAHVFRGGDDRAFCVFSGWLSCRISHPQIGFCSQVECQWWLKFLEQQINRHKKSSICCSLCTNACSTKKTYLNATPTAAGMWYSLHLISSWSQALCMVLHGVLW